MALKILVTGGAGYIGSHTVKILQQQGYQVVILDNLVYGHRQAVSCPLVKADLLDKKAVAAVFDQYHFDAVMHFAAYALAGESMLQPAKYFENNVLGGLNLLEAMRQNGVKNLVFSSTCATYGYPKKLPVTEQAPQQPVSVYGESKLMMEKIFGWYDELFCIKSIFLRYFNAAGASLDEEIGEDHDPETHLIPIAIQAALGQRKEFQIFGDDYKTPDGTCIRDYVHVLDLADAHLKALAYLQSKNKSDVFNLGTGQGYSVKQVVDEIKKVSKVDFPIKVAPRRPGDPDAVWADNQKARKILGWSPKYSDLKTIISSAYRWHQKHSDGFSR